MGVLDWIISMVIFKWNDLSKKAEFENELDRLRSEHEAEVKELERNLSEKREELGKMLTEKGKLLQRCEKLEAKALHL